MEKLEHLMVIDEEANSIIKEFPVVQGVLRFDDKGRGRYNAYIYVENHGYGKRRLCILPGGGGWLGIESDDWTKIKGDIAPFSD